MISYLPRCCASIRDQVCPGIEVEHIVVDGGSDDGTIEWLESQAGVRVFSNFFVPKEKAILSNGYNLQWISEPDQGMYDAIHKGWQRATGDVLAWLNCDEQYMPGTLEKVASLFQRNSTIDFIYGDTLLVRPDGTAISYRTATPLRKIMLAVMNLYVHSSSTFFKHDIFKNGFIMDTTWKTAGDWALMRRLLLAGHKGMLINECLSAYTRTGNNLADKSKMLGDYTRIRKQRPWWSFFLRHPLIVLRRLEKFTRQGYKIRKNYNYELITADLIRKPFVVKQVGYGWE